MLAYWKNLSKDRVGPKTHIDYGSVMQEGWLGYFSSGWYCVTMRAPGILDDGLSSTTSACACDLFITVHEPLWIIGLLDKMARILW